MSELNISIAKSSRGLNKNFQSINTNIHKADSTFHSQMSYEKIKKYSNYEELKFNEILTQMSCNTSQPDINLLTSLLHTCFSIREMIYTYSDYTEIISATGALERLYCKYSMENVETSDAYTKMELFIAIGAVSAQVTEALNSRQMFEDKLHKMQIDFSSNILSTTNRQETPPLLENSSKNSQYDKEQSRRMQTDPLSVLWFIKYLIDHNFKRPDKKQLRLLSFWTNLSEKKLNDWFSKTYQNYIRKNDQKSAHKKLAERAIKIGRQLRRPNSLKISRSSIKFNKSSPYERES